MSKKPTSAMGKVSSLVSNLLSETVETPSDKDTKSASSPPRPATSDAASGASGGDDLMAHIARIFEANGSAIIGKLYFVDLADLKKRYADQWERVAKTVHPTVENVIAEYVAEGDYHARLNDAYFLVFARLSKAEAERTCATIKQEVEKRLFGDAVERYPRLSMKTIVIEVDGSIGLKEVSSLAELDRILEEEARKGQLPPDMSFIYRAMWNARRKIVSSYICQPFYRLPDGTELVGDHVNPDPRNPALVGELDRLTIEAVRDTLATMATKKRRVFMAFPVHFSTLADPAMLKSYLASLNVIPRPHQRMMVTEIVGIPQRHDTIFVAQIVAALRHFNRAVLARFPLESMDFDDARTSGIVGVGADLAGISVSESELIPMMDSYVEAANSVGMRTYVHGLPSLSLTTAAVCAGFNHVDGDAVMSIVDEPPGSYPLDPSKLYAHLLPGG